MFKRWCAEQKIDHGGNKLSHVLMNGGVLSVPSDRLNEFYDKCIEAVLSGDKIYVVEQKTKYYNFFVDVDYKADDALDLNEIQSICKIICNKMMTKGGKECLISVAEPKPSGDKIKTGIHLNFPGFVVNQASAIALREHILVALYIAKGSEDWEKIIDSAVYGDISKRSKGSGFRMPWSHKMTKGVTEGPYLPVFVYKPGGLLSSLTKIGQRPDAQILAMSAVRTTSTDFVTIEGPTKAIKEGSFTEIQTKDEVSDIELKYNIERFIQKNMNGQSDARVSKLFKFDNRYLISSNSKYCENLGRNHGSNHVYFYISGDRITQKCFCTCDTLDGRRSGYCKDFVGSTYQLNQSIVDKLYPEKEEMRKCIGVKKTALNNSGINTMDCKSDMENFIVKHVDKQHTDLKVIKIQKNGKNYIIGTTSTYCEIAGKHHDDKCTSFILTNKGKIKQDCGICKGKKSKIHTIIPKIMNKLYRK
jgi:hypothetical protein